MIVSKNAIGSIDLICITDEEALDLAAMIQGSNLPLKRGYHQIAEELKKNAGAAK